MNLNKCCRCGAFHTNPGDVCPKCISKDNLELSKFNSLEDGELENMNAVKEVDELINKIKFYK